MMTLRRSPELALSVIVVVLSGWYAFFLARSTPLNLNHDELNFLYEALRLPAQHKLSGYPHGSLMYELIAAVETATYIVLRVSQRVSTPFDYLVNVLSNLGPHLRMCRAITAVAALATVVQLFRVGTLFGGKKVGVLAALLCASNFTFIAMTSICKEDVLSWLLILVAMELAWRATSRGSPALGAAAGAAIGAATAAKFLGVFAGALALLPLVCPSSLSTRRRATVAVTIAVCATAAFLLLFPFLFTDTATVVASIRYLERAFAGMGHQLAIRAYLGHHLHSLMGTFVLAAAAVELVRRVIVEPRGPIMFVIVPIMQLAFLGLRRGYSMPHYVFPVAIFGFILAASLIVVLSAKAAAAGRYIAPAIVVLTVLIDPTYAQSSIKHALLITGPDTRLQAHAIFTSLALPGDCVIINQSIRGENALGPPVSAILPRSSHGPFGRALEEAVAHRPGPHYEVRLFPGADVLEKGAEGCRWIIAGRFSRRLSGAELGTRSYERIVGDPVVPSAFKMIARVDAFPEPHSVWFPYPTTLDYDDLRAVRFGDLLKKRSFGLTFFIYER